MLAHMTVLALRYDTRPGRFRSGHGRGSGFVRDARATRAKNQMDESRTMKLHALQERIEREEYDVDPHQVADAIVERLLSARNPASPVTRRTS
jgi:Anti-sigma-28 factor, FlgM